MVQMSVHSLPPARQTPDQRTRRGRLKMLAVWAVCAAPVVASYLTFYVFRPQGGQAAYGALIMPARAMPLDANTMPLADLDGRAVNAASLKGQWLLVAVAGGSCDARCEKHLYLQRQLREMLGRDKDRLDRVWLIPDRAQVRPELLASLKGAWVLRSSEVGLKGWLTPDPGQALDAHLYLIDPRGDWMMRFPADADAKGIKKDLARLMKANESWDEPGR